MPISKRALATILAATVAGLSSAVAVTALGAPGAGHQGRGGHGGAQLITASLAPSQLSDPMFHGVTRGNAPWVLTRGNVRLTRNGKLDLRVKGLVIPALGTPGGVNTISASLYCGADSNLAAADSTQQVPISRGGDARIHDTSFGVPSTCLAPVILVHPNGAATLYIAVDGWRP